VQTFIWTHLIGPVPRRASRCDSQCHTACILESSRYRRVRGYRFRRDRRARMNTAGLDIYLLHGNHDAASKLTKQLRPPGNVQIFRASEPQTFTNDKLRVAIHGPRFALRRLPRISAPNTHLRFKDSSKLEGSTRTFREPPNTRTTRHAPSIR